MNGRKFHHLDYRGDKTTYKVCSIKYISSLLCPYFKILFFFVVFLFLL